ncbi:hypothetical protein SB48_HM08orf06265 [Heyndrickxia coagulans]|uniref:Uncharacterized protein n=1 Tax=Heyndrickxia coagulans TaxID=1398 RepID=A0AAN0WDR9_HEYCO|nr:hypothetical protein SB48_HM08orf06265 [Heyndrickxia coagulans]
MIKKDHLENEKGWSFLPPLRKGSTPQPFLIKWSYVVNDLFLGSRS